MNRKILLLSSLIFMYLLFVVVFFVQASETMTVKADVLATSLSVEIPSEIYFGEIAAGYKSDNIKIEINNTGNSDISVTPELDENYNGTIFQNLFLRKRTSGDSSTIYSIGNFTLNIEKPTNLGGEKNEYFYTYLDLTNYSGTIEEDLTNHSAQIIFTVVAA